MKKFFNVLLALLCAFGLVLAQESDAPSDTNDPAQHSDMHDNDMHDHSDMHDMDSTEDMNHDDHAMMDMASSDNSANTVMLGELAVLVEPLVTLDGELILGLRPEGMLMGELELMATTPMGEMVTDSKQTMQLALLELGQAQEGVYRISGSYNGADFSFPISLYQQNYEGTDVYLLLAPSPTLANRGTSEVFAYAMKDGENLHSGFMVTRHMDGMQHSSDAEQVQLMHSHFDDVYDAALGETPMSNQTPLGFSMVGTWQLELIQIGSEMQSFVFDVDMLEN